MYNSIKCFKTKVLETLKSVEMLKWSLIFKIVFYFLLLLNNGNIDSPNIAICNPTHVPLKTLDNQA